MWTVKLGKELDGTGGGCRGVEEAQLLVIRKGRQNTFLRDKAKEDLHYFNKRLIKYVNLHFLCSCL